MFALEPITPNSLYMGIDGGGSGLRVAIADASLALYGNAEGPPANPSAIGRARAAAIVQESMRAALGDLPSQAIVAVAVGLAGTGALAYGVNNLGESALAGGWGYLLGDEGSGYWLGLEGLRAVLRAEDGRGPETVLSAGLLPALGLHTARELIPWLYRATAPRTAEVASLAPQILDAALLGDACAADIVHRGAKELAQAAQAVMRRLAMPAPQIAFAGGLLQGLNPLSDALCRLLALDHAPQPLYPPVIGAVLLARELSR